jgi:hypothetical protein
MADGPDNTTVNGREVSYVQLRVRAHVEGGGGGDDDGPTLEMPDIKDINYASDKATGKAGGPGSRFTRRTLGGRKTFSAGMTLYRSGALALKKGLGDIAEARGLIGDDGEIEWGDVEVTYQMTFSYKDADAFQSIEIRQCTVINESETCAEGEAAQEVAYTLDPMNIVEKIGGKYYAI